jgi:hypothetical protein
MKKAVLDKKYLHTYSEACLGVQLNQMPFKAKPDYTAPRLGFLLHV